MRKRWGQRYQLGVKSLVALDMPFTAVMDTLLLPWDMFRTDSSIKSRVEKSEKATLATNSVIRQRRCLPSKLSSGLRNPQLAITVHLLHPQSVYRLAKRRSRPPRAHAHAYRLKGDISRTGMAAGNPILQRKTQPLSRRMPVKRRLDTRRVMRQLPRLAPAGNKPQLHYAGVVAHQKGYRRRRGLARTQWRGTFTSPG